ncbi:MAG: hypothetical protein EXR65_01815 [Dehalococcoidia bacterium]|nr:hypothetical protein [Dehalococcoidia bacterium]
MLDRLRRRHKGEHRAAPPGRLPAGRLPAAREAAPPDEVGLGELLRAARRQRALTIAEIANDTRINADYLEALEQEHYDVLPAPVYARGFLRAYAKHLELDPETALSLLPRDLPRPPELEPFAGLRRRPPSTFPALRVPSLRLIAIAALVAVALLLAFWRFAGGV